MSAVAGALLGCAVGDALGLPYENLSKRRGVRFLGPPDRHRLLFGYGMVSDDTDHSRMVCQALCESPVDADGFARALARRFRWWLLAAPAGIGFATLRSILKLWLGFPPGKNGVFSAGNGPAMRSPVLGAALDDIGRLKTYLRASTRLTHTDPKAEHGAFAVALAAWAAKRGTDRPADFFPLLAAHSDPDAAGEFPALMRRVEISLAAGDSTDSFAAALSCGRGVTGYVYRTVPVVLHAWLRHPHDFKSAVGDVIRCGGDTDTTAAIVGGIIGSGGRDRLPADWLAGVRDWPYSVRWLETLAADTERAVSSGTAGAVPEPWPGAVLLRNAAFLTVVLGHVLRRTLPPY